eukprot:jgi/Botrbrau1/6047/Bobra.0042s0030.1
MLPKKKRKLGMVGYSLGYTRPSQQNSYRPRSSMGQESAFKTLQHPEPCSTLSEQPTSVHFPSIISTTLFAAYPTLYCCECAGGLTMITSRPPAREVLTSSPFVIRRP